jgi:hypothetical protein
LLGLLLSIGYPPLVNTAHVTVDGEGRRSLLFVGDVAPAWAAASESAARLPRDIGKPDPAATAYMLAAQAGDAFGVLASSYLGRHELADFKELVAPQPNQAAAVTHRKQRVPTAGSTDQTLLSWLGELASSAVDADSDTSLFDAPLMPLAAEDSLARDRARLQHVLADPDGATPAALVEAADQLDAGTLSSDQVLRGSPNSSELRQAAAARGDTGAALRVAVEHLQQNETLKAQPLLELVNKSSADPAQAEMAQYYLERYAGEVPNATAAWPHLVKAADLGRQDAELLVAHANAGGSVAGSPNMSNVTKAMQQYQHIADRAPSGRLNEMQAFAAYNLGVLTLRNPDVAADLSSGDGSSGEHAQQSTSPSPSSDSPSSQKVEPLANQSAESNSSTLKDDTSPTEAKNVSQEIPRPPDAQGAFTDVALSRLPLVRMALLLQQRAARLGDTTGALLLASLTSDIGHIVGHADAASLWDSWAQHRPPHLGPHREQVFAEPSRMGQPCNLSGWWTTGSTALAAQNVSRTFATSVEGGGFEMFNASLSAGASTLEGFSTPEIIFPSPERSKFKHLHSFLWHTTVDVLSDGAPVPVALQPPDAVPHLVEHHHQRGKLLANKACTTLRIEAMHVNWTFHRLGPASTVVAEEPSIDESVESRLGCQGTCPATDTAISMELNRVQDFLHCWIRPEWYFVALEANLAARPLAAAGTNKPAPGTWEAILALTSSSDCPCHGAFSCRRGDGACVAFSDATLDVCPPGSRLCSEVPPEFEPSSKPGFAALPEVCALAYHRRTAVGGNTDAMHVLSHAYSNGVRGAPKDAAEAFSWSS